MTAKPSLTKPNNDYNNLLTNIEILHIKNKVKCLFQNKQYEIYKQVNTKQNNVFNYKQQLQLQF